MSTDWVNTVLLMDSGHKMCCHIHCHTPGHHLACKSTTQVLGLSTARVKGINTYELLADIERERDRCYYCRYLK
jgi:hypothetical protein